jgi:hypothetical protein
MDGFQALTAIKNDPRTATIPVMMYTSQEGELYLSQARALGAMGVLPKQTRPADVSHALEQLRLLGEHRLESEIATVRVPSLRDAEEPPEPDGEPRPTRISAAPAGGLTPEMRGQLDLMLRDHGIELRRFVAQSLSQHTGQIISEVRTLISGTNDQAAPQYPDSTPAPQEPDRAGGATFWLGAVAAAIALFAAVLWYYAANDRTRSVDQPQSSRAASVPSAAATARHRRETAPTVVAGEIARTAAARNAPVMVEPVPYICRRCRETSPMRCSGAVGRRGSGCGRVRSILAILSAGPNTVTLPRGPYQVDRSAIRWFRGVASRDRGVNMLSAQHSHGRGAV